MAILHNRVSHKEPKEKIKQDTTPRLTISFYNYFPIPEPEEFRNKIRLRYRKTGKIVSKTFTVKEQLAGLFPLSLTE